MDKIDTNMQKKVRYISLDVVFYGNSLNYDWGGGTNYQELKKVTKWDGRQYVLVSRYALRYSILHWANTLFPDEWKLADNSVLHVDKGEVVRLKKDDRDFIHRIFKEFPEFDLFGFMVAKKGSNEAALTRVSPVKISHAISMTPTNLDAHTMANLDMVKRGGGKGSNPVTIEEKPDFYVYNITIDVNRVGKYLKEEHGKEWDDIEIDGEKAKNRIIQLIETILDLKRDIKGRREDLSPWLVILGVYEDGRYETYMDKIQLKKKTKYAIKRLHKKEGDLEIIENEIDNSLIPTFKIDINNSNIDNLRIYYREGFCDYEPKLEKLKVYRTKSKILDYLKEVMGL